MLLLMRPSKPSDFDSKVAEAQRAVEEAIRAGRAPEFPELWTEFKEHFVKAQYFKCGYCEVYSGNHPGSMDHYAPKSEVHELIDKGAELDGGQRVRGRRTKPVSDRGYWWCAYSWGNWIFVCERCNSVWKKCLFPVTEEPRRLPPDPATRETPLLLNPFGPEDPVEHLWFSELGQVAAQGGSLRGQATIDTCGLDRESLRSVRQRTAHKAYRHIECLLEGIESGNWERAGDALENLLDLGHEEAPHAGMVRSIVKSELELPWNEFLTLNERIAGR